MGNLEKTAKQYERLDEIADPVLQPAVVLQVLPTDDHPGLVPQLCPCEQTYDKISNRNRSLPKARRHG